MIKASFSSVEDAPSNDIKIYNTFSSQCTENPPFRFFWDTRYKDTIHQPGEISLPEILACDTGAARRG